jgi:hypothetical protein
MLITGTRSNKLTGRALRLLHTLSERIAAAVLFAAILVFFSSPTFAQQRVVVEKATGNVVDVGDGSLQYDSRYYDQLDLANSPIPAGEDVRKYTRNAAGAIVLRPKDELVSNFADEWRNDLILRINSMSASSDVKALLVEIVKGLRR